MYILPNPEEIRENPGRNAISENMEEKSWEELREISEVMLEETIRETLKAIL